MGKFATQMKRADAAGAHFALIIGEDELAANSVTIKPMRGGEQVTVAASEAASYLMQQLAGV